MKIREEEIIHQFEKAKARLGKEEISDREYEGLAEQAAAEGRHYAAAVFYHLAESQALPSPEADRYKELTREMLRKVDGQGQDSGLDHLD